VGRYECNRASAYGVVGDIFATGDIERSARVCAFLVIVKADCWREIEEEVAGGQWEEIENREE